MELFSSEPVDMATVKKILQKRSKEEELGYEQQQALEHAERFSKLDEKAVHKLSEELRKQEKLAPDSRVKIMDLLPRHAETLKAILAKDKIELTDEELAHLLQIVQKASA